MPASESRQRQPRGDEEVAEENDGGMPSQSIGQQVQKRIAEVKRLDLCCQGLDTEVVVDSRNGPGRLFFEQRSRNKTAEELVWFAAIAETKDFRSDVRTFGTVLFGWSVTASRSSKPGFELWLKQDATGFILTKMYLVPKSSLGKRNLFRLSEHQGRDVMTH